MQKTKKSAQAQKGLSWFLNSFSLAKCWRLLIFA